MKSVCAGAPLVVLAFLTLASSVAGQTFRDDISITEVEVPVQVLVNNRAVAGLERQNFVLKVDGEPQELTWFQAIELDERGLIASAREAKPAEAKQPPVPAPAPSVTWSRNYLLLFDFAFSSRDRLERGVDGVREMLQSQSHPSDRLAIAFYAQSLGARILVPFTSDRRGLELGLAFLDAVLDAKSRKSLERLEELDAWWRQVEGDRGLPDPMLADLAGGADTLFQPIVRPPQLAGLGLPMVRPDPASDPSDPDSERDYKVSRLNALFGLNYGSGLSQVRELSRSMASLVTLLRDVSEPKHLFYLSEGLGAGLFGGAGTSTSTLERLKPMLNAFRATGWTLQAIDLTGLLPPPASVFTGPEDFDGDLELRGTGVEVVSAFADDSLFYFANETGGEVYENYNRIHKATEKILERSRVTYLLAFQPGQELADGDRHDIEVELVPDIRGARVLHRPGFRAPGEPLDRSLTERRMDAAELALSGEERSELEMSVRPIVVRSGDGAAVPLFLEVGTADLDTGRKGKKKARLDLHGYALDSAGEVRGGFARQLKFRIDDEETVDVATELRLAPGSYDLRVLAWDLRSGRQHTVQTPIEVAAAEPSEAEIVGLFFLDTSASSRRFGPAKREATQALALLELGDELVFPDHRPRIASGRSRHFVVAVAGGATDLELGARVLDSGDEVVASVELDPVAASEAGGRSLVGTVDCAGLAPGRYRLEVGSTSVAFAVLDAR